MLNEIQEKVLKIPRAILQPMDPSSSEFKLINIGLIASMFIAGFLLMVLTIFYQTKIKK
jgi:hypothetical protein